MSKASESSHPGWVTAFASLPQLASCLATLPSAEAAPSVHSLTPFEAWDSTSHRRIEEEELELGLEQEHLLGHLLEQLVLGELVLEVVMQVGRLGLGSEPLLESLQG